MAIRSDEITSIIKSAIDAFDAGVETRSVGTVVEVGDGIAQIYGLDGALASELLEFPGGVRGLALNLQEDTVGLRKTRQNLDEERQEVWALGHAARLAERAPHPTPALPLHPIGERRHALDGAIDLIG